MRIATRLATTVGAGFLLTGFAVSASAQDCELHADSTFALIEKVIFEQKGCTSATCHSGGVPAGGLDLSPGVAYDNLVDVPPQTVSIELHTGLARVSPGSKGRSLLWLNVASATLPELWQAPLRSMPSGGLPPLTFDELELVRIWIEYGATRDGVVPGSGDSFNACLPPPKPLAVTPLEPPPPGIGVQLRSPRQTLPPRTERETCFVSYYDLTDQVPAEFRSPDGTQFRYKRADARQDPHSHHGVVFDYHGRAAIDDPVWGPFACTGGARHGSPCNPTDLDACGADGICATTPVQSVACIGFGPGDAGIGNGSKTLFSSMGSSVGGTEGIYNEAPIKGTLVWNSHAFNLTDEPAKLDMWINFEFAAPEEQLHRLDLFVDISAISKMNVPAFRTEEVCHRYVVPPRVRVVDLISHQHQRGKRFRVFEGDFACQGGQLAGNACSPFGPDEGLSSPDLCAGAPCASPMAPRVGDCNHDMAVAVDELVLGVNIALNTAGVMACRAFDGDASGSVTVDELVGAVDAALNPRRRDPQESLLYTSLTYADPLLLTFNPPRRFGTAGASARDRTLTYCGLYDNGFTSPNEVKRRSRLPSNAAACFPTHCAEGAVGRPCSRDPDCDSSPGAGDGACDACTVGFGISTDDEMFVLIASHLAD